jgi:hypothetical protein
MKTNKNFNYLTLFIIVLLSSCNKGESTKVQPSINLYQYKILNSTLSKVPKIKSMKSINQQNDIVKSLMLNYPKIINFNSSEIANYTKIEFENKPNLLGLQISIKINNNQSSDLFYVIDTSKNVNFGVIRNILNIEDNDSITNQITFLDFDGNKITNNYIQNASFANMSPNLDYNLNKNSTKVNGSFKWNCTNAQFNAIYQEAKNRCESNWICDLGCSFSICSISYVAYAIDQCTTYL